jgi:hypothetical protein
VTLSNLDVLYVGNLPSSMLLFPLTTLKIIKSWSHASSKYHILFVLYS